MLLFCSCADRQQSDSCPVLRVSLEQQEVSMKDLFGRLEVIPLETSDSCLLVFPDKVIAQAFHPLLSSFEVILRNQLHYALARHFSDGNWIINQKSGFMVASSLTYTNKRTKKKVTNDYILKDFVQNVGDPPAEEKFDFINL